MHVQSAISINRQAHIFLCVDAILNINDLHKVQDTVWDARAKWYNIGLQLGLSSDSLDAIESDHREQSDNCFTAMLKQWLRRGNPRPTWHALAKALTSRPVGRSYLAEQLSPH